MSRPTAVPIPSATILLIRDGSAGLEVFLLERHSQTDFATGAFVFPGGKVESGDAEPALHERCVGTHGLEAEAVTLRIAAIRETFEECGVLLARPRGGGPLLGGDRLHQLEERYRVGLLADTTAMPEVAESEDLELACDLLVPFAHWITPEFLPKRFDTHFFAVPAPGDQVALHDGSESVDSLWIEPSRAVAEAKAGSRTMMFPTLLNLQKLGRSRDVAEAMDRARREPVVTVLPRVERGSQGPRVLIPPEAGYDVREVSLEAIR